MIETTHEHCHICEGLAREAERTAKEDGLHHWSSQTWDGGIVHTAHYTKEATR